MAGAITSSSVAAVGSGYTSGDSLLVTGGGGTAGVVILTVGGGGVPSSYTLPDQGFAIGAGRGCGYSVASNVPCSGGTGTGFKINILAVGPGTNATHGTIGGTSVSSTGSGYAPADTGFFVQGANTSSVYIIDTVDGGGGVTTYNIDSADGYEVGIATTTPGGPQPGSGSGFTLAIASVFPCSGGVQSGYRNKYYVMK